MSIELKVLRWAIVAAQHRSLRQAAQTLNVRQSTLSRTLRDLESELGVALFKRTNGGTTPTADGKEFLEAAQNIVDETDAITVRLKARARGESGQLAIGVHTSLSTGNLRATLIEYQRRHPQVETRLVDGSAAHLVAGLARSSIDIAIIVEGTYRWDERSLPIWSERVVIALPENHPLSDRASVHWSDLSEQFVLLPKGGPGPEFLDVLSGKLGAGSLRRVVSHDVSLDRLLTLVGVGSGVLMALEGATGVTYPGVTFREVMDVEGAARLTFRASWKSANSNPSLRGFLDLLQERYPDLSGGSQVAPQPVPSPL